MAKLQNIKAIREMLAGEHKTQTKVKVGFGDHKEAEEIREEGDVWVQDGKTWTIKNGIKQSIRKGINFSDLYDFSKCEEGCKKNQYNITDYDKKMSAIHGMCFDCVLKLETKLRLTGEWEEYEKKKVKENALAWLTEAEQEVLELKEAMTKTEFVNKDGDIEKWGLEKDAETIIEEIDEQWDKYKKSFYEQFGITEDETSIKTDD